MANRSLLVALLLCACQRAEPPAPPAEAARAKPAPVAPAPPVASAVASAAPEAPDAAPVSVQPELLDADGGALPQTEDRPATDSPFFSELARDLFDAIVKDDPELARHTFFPRVAYRQVKAIANPDRDYDRRLMKAFERDIHDYHDELGAHPEKAELVALEVPSDRARWMKPGSEGNKLGYYRVLRSALRFRDAAGKERSLTVTSLISWRGEWYVVHLNGFQ